MKFLVLMIAFMLCAPAFAAGEDATWEQSFGQAERALAQSNYWEARKIFSVSLDEAERCNQDVLLAQKLDSLAETYALNNRPRVAETLHKKAVEIFRRRLGEGHEIVARSINKFVQVLRHAGGNSTAAAPSRGSGTVLAASQSG